MKNMDKDIGKLIKNARAEMGFSREMVAESLDVATSTVYRWEKGELAPSFLHVSKLCQVLKVPIVHFVPDSEKLLTAKELSEMMTVIASLGEMELEILRDTLKALSKPLPVKAQKKNHA